MDQAKRPWLTYMGVSSSFGILVFSHGQFAIQNIKVNMRGWERRGVFTGDGESG